MDKSKDGYILAFVLVISIMVSSFLIVSLIYNSTYIRSIKNYVNTVEEERKLEESVYWYVLENGYENNEKYQGIIPVYSRDNKRYVFEIYYENNELMLIRRIE